MFATRRYSFFLCAAAAVCLAGCGPDSIKGNYAIQVNPAPNATYDQMQRTAVAFGYAQLSLNPNHTYQFGGLTGTWSRSGSTLTLEPTHIPKAGFFEATTMGDTVSVLTKTIELKISDDEKKLTAAGAPKGPIVFTKTNNGLNM
jgi:hypothetical protein